MIDEEGIESLTIQELRTACRERGIPDKGRSRAFLSRQLSVSLNQPYFLKQEIGVVGIVYQEKRTYDSSHSI